MNALDVAVVIVTYKCAQLTINAIASIEAERQAPGLSIRVIVVDNASGDFEPIARAVEAKGWSAWVALVCAPTNGGFAYGNNLGIEQALRDGAPAYFYLLNPDTEVRLGAIPSLVRFMEHHLDVGIAGSGIDNPDGSEWPIAFRFPSLRGEVIAGLETGLVTRLLRRWEVPQRMFKRSQSVDWVSGASMMLRPSMLHAIGCLDENYFLYFEETDLCFRAMKAGFSTWYVPDGRVMHLEGQSTNVNKRNSRPARRPSYWFESRRRYFALAYGIRRAIVIDMAAVAAYSLGLLKRLVLGRMRDTPPYFIRDLIRHSIVWPGNRRSIPSVRTFRPPLRT